MIIRSFGVPIFIAIGVSVWLAVSIAVVAKVIQSPVEHVDRAIGLALIWILLPALAAMSRPTERIGRSH